MNKWQITGGIAGCAMGVLIIVYLLIGAIAASQIESQVFKHTGVPLKIGSANLSLFSGTIVVSNLTIPNPKGFTTYNDAFSLDSIKLAVSLSSLFSDTIHVKELRVVAPHVYIEKANNQVNLKALADIVKRDKSQAESVVTKAKTTNDKKSELKLIIDHLSIEKTSLFLDKSLIPDGRPREYAINDLVLKNIGKTTNGASVTDVTGIVLAKIQEHAGDLPRRIILSSIGNIGMKLLTQPVGTLVGSSKVILQTTGGAAKTIITETPGAIIDTVTGAPGTVIDGVKAGQDALENLLPFGGSKKE